MNKETRFSKVFLITVIAIGIIFYIYFLRTGKKPAPAPSDIGEEKLPLIFMSTSLEKPTSVEEYGMMTEYYTDSDLVDLSTKVKIKLTLNIDKAYLITKITITRSVGVEKRDTKVITNQDFKKGDNIIFFESKQGENMIATHKFSVTYTSAINSVDIGGPTTEVTINYDDISLLETFDSDTIINYDQLLLQGGVAIPGDYIGEYGVANYSTYNGANNAGWTLNAWSLRPLRWNRGDRNNSLYVPVPASSSDPFAIDTMFHRYVQSPVANGFSSQNERFPFPTKNGVLWEVDMKNIELSCYNNNARVTGSNLESTYGTDNLNPFFQLVCNAQSNSWRSNDYVFLNLYFRRTNTVGKLFEFYWSVSVKNNGVINTTPNTFCNIQVDLSNDTVLKYGWYAFDPLEGIPEFYLSIGGETVTSKPLFSLNNAYKKFHEETYGGCEIQTPVDPYNSNFSSHMGWAFTHFGGDDTRSMVGDNNTDEGRNGIKRGLIFDMMYFKYNDAFEKGGLEVTNSDQKAIVNTDVGSVDLTPSSITNLGNFTLAFRHGSGTTDTSSTNCTLYSSLTAGEYDWGTVNSVSSTSTKTTYNVTFSQMNNVKYLVLAGGGGGRNDYPGGGGGGGGMLDGTETNIPGNTYDIVVGNGGGVNTSGTDSSFHTFTAIGGGYGSSNTGGSGGSGGGGGTGNPGGTGVAGPPRQGYNGGTGDNSTYSSGAGGGGAGGNGGNGGNGSGGQGGGGRSWSFNSVIYAGGGGGGTRNRAGGNGGSGGGGQGGQRLANGTNGTNYLGGGGGCKASGGSGTVILNFDATQVVEGYAIRSSKKTGIRWV